MLNRVVHGNTLELNMARPPANALDEALLRDLALAIASAPESGAQAIVLSGQPGMFSGGMDVVDLMQRDRDGVAASWRAFFDVCRNIALSSVPVVAAVTGHSPAGGAVMAIHCDYRVMAEGNFKIGLNEVAVGLYVPALIQRVFARLVGEHRAERLLVAGAMVDSQRAAEIGLVDSICPVDQVVAQAVAFCAGLQALPPLAMRRTRAIARANLQTWYSDAESVIDDAFLASFLAEETQQTLRALVSKLKSRG